MIPDALMQAIRGFQESRALLTAIELDLFTAASEGGTAAAISERAGTDRRATEMVLNVLVSFELLRKDGLRYVITESGQAVKDARPALMHMVNLWPRWSTLTDCVRGGGAVLERGPAGRDESWTESFIAAMHRNASERAPVVVEAVGAKAVKRMLDLGGGSGAYSIAFAQANPELHSDILDLEPVCAIAGRHIQAAGLSDRIKTRPGDLNSSPYGTGYDLVWISQICHMLGPEENLAMLRSCAAALGNGGRVVIQDFILNPDKTSPRNATLFALNMLVGTRNGSTYSSEEYAAWLREAGLVAPEHVRLPGHTGLMIASRPA